MQTQISPILFDALSNNPFIIEATDQRDILKHLTSIERVIHSILELGDLEHTGDWDPYLDIKLKTTSNIELISGSESDLDEALSGAILSTANGYPEFQILPEPNERTENSTLSIMVTCYNDDSDDFSVSIPITDIISITLQR